MLIRKIEVKNFKCLVEPLLIEGLSSGINVIAGDNEEGKSTLLHAIKAAIFQKHSATSQTVKDFSPYNAKVKSEVGIEFDYAGKSYSIRKKFGSKGSAEFRSADSVAQDSEAEEKIRELFGFGMNVGDKAGSRSAADQDNGIWGLLWLEQGAASKGLSTSAGGKESLMKALDGDLSSVIGGEHGRALLKQISLRYLEDFTASTGKEKGEVKKAIDHLEATRLSLSECRDKHALHQKKLQILNDKQEQLAKHDKDKTLETIRVEMEKLALDLRTIEKLRLELSVAEKNEQALRLEWEACKKKLDERKSLAVVVEKSKAELEQLGKDSQLAEEALKLSELAKTDALSRRDLAVVKVEEAQKQIDNCQRREARIKLRQNHSAMLEQISLLDESEKELARLRQQASEISIDETKVQSLRSLSRELESALVRSSAAATKLLLKPLPSHRATVNGKEFESTAELSILKQTTIKLDDWGEIDITPGGEETEKYSKQAESTRIAFDKALIESGVESLSAAEEILQNLKTIKLAVESSVREIARNWPSGRGGLSKQVQEFESQLVGDTDAENADASGDNVAPAELDLLTSRSNFEAAKTAEQQQHLEVEKNRETQEKAKQHSFQLSTRMNSLRKTLDGEEQRLLNLSQIPLLEEQTAYELAEKSMVQSQSQTRVKKLELDQLDETSLRKKHEESTKRHSTISTMITALNNEITNLAAEINAEGQTGLGEKLERLEGEFQVAEQKCERLRKNAQALKLLHGTLNAAQEECKTQILQPVLNILHPHLVNLFPGTNLVLDHSKIEISHLERDGYKEPYLNLSMGTREQLSILTRIAMAQLLRKEGQPCTIILDDALVYSDDTRLNHMKKLLKEVSAEIQVLILTCRLRDYADIPGAKIIELAQCSAAPCQGARD